MTTERNDLPDHGNRGRALTAAFSGAIGGFVVAVAIVVLPAGLTGVTTQPGLHRLLRFTFLAGVLAGALGGVLIDWAFIRIQPRHGVERMWLAAGITPTAGLAMVVAHWVGSWDFPAPQLDMEWLATALHAATAFAAYTCLGSWTRVPPLTRSFSRAVAASLCGFVAFETAKLVAEFSGLTFSHPERGPFVFLASSGYLACLRTGTWSRDSAPVGQELRSPTNPLEKEILNQLRHQARVDPTVGVTAGQLVQRVPKALSGTPNAGTIQPGTVRKAVQRLRQKGYDIRRKPNSGYYLESHET